VLVVDDEPDIREIARLALERLAGWTVSTASSGREALEKAATEQPEVILLDVMMPEIDGRETARQLAANPATSAIPVILLTAKAMTTERAQLAAEPVVGVLTKPFDPVSLALDVERLLGWAT
jgi:CheY-like chemotaxis protein